METEEMKDLKLEEMAGVSGGELSWKDKDKLMAIAWEAKSKNLSWDEITALAKEYGVNRQECFDYIKRIWDIV